MLRRRPNRGHQQVHRGAPRRASQLAALLGHPGSPPRPWCGWCRRRRWGHRGGRWQPWVHGIPEVSIHCGFQLHAIFVGEADVASLRSRGRRPPAAAALRRGVNAASPLLRRLRRGALPPAPADEALQREVIHGGLLLPDGIELLQSSPQRWVDAVLLQTAGRARSRRIARRRPWRGASATPGDGACALGLRVVVICAPRRGWPRR
mmetsp:Transcript_90231/g.260163  ORF Transcript_90231/g.260163 Transcript_90231/m.260163 type:complete len:206 (-) Transcript_90231:244-861(-)